MGATLFKFPESLKFLSHLPYHFSFISLSLSFFFLVFIQTPLFTTGWSAENDTLLGNDVSSTSNNSKPEKLTLQEWNVTKAFSTPNSSAPSSMTRLTSIYTAAVIRRLVENYQARTTTNDLLNEDYYIRSRIGDNVWYNIERVLPFKMFVQWMVNTSYITDRYDHKAGKTLINDYIQKPGVPCASQSAFQFPNDAILADDKTRRAQLDSSVSKWHAVNWNTPPQKMCNRFRGLQCNPGKGVCECESEQQSYVTYTRTGLDPPNLYRDGCYVKAWHNCRHLSLDPDFPSEYSAYHAHPDNMKQFLIRMATPLPKMTRCERGTSCVDLIVGQKRPLCWCNSRQYSKDCYNTNASVPLLDRFLQIRRAFHQMMILEKDRETHCSVDPDLAENLWEIQKLAVHPKSNFLEIVQLMKQVLMKRGKGEKFCDFRKGMACDPYKRTCTYRTSCGPGRSKEIVGGRDTCRVNNGYPCTTLELQCVKGAVCKDFGQGKHCHCAPNKFGDLCRFEGSTFFGGLLQSRVSGFIGKYFVNLQEIVNHVLTPLEDLMTLGYGQLCNTALDLYTLSIIRYLGNVRGVLLDQMDGVLGAIQYLVGKDEPLCDYRSFLGCAPKSGTCEPMYPDVALYETLTPELRANRDTPAAGKRGNVGKVILTLKPQALCGTPGNRSNNVPAIYHDMVFFQCVTHYVCRRRGEDDTRSHRDSTRYCLCPVGYQGPTCQQRVPQLVQVVNVYELPAPVIVLPEMNTTGKMQHRSIIVG